MPRINNAKNFAGVKYATQNFVQGLVDALNLSSTTEIEKLQNLVKIDGNGTVDGIGAAFNSIVDITAVEGGQDTYKIKASVLPDLAITRTITFDMTEDVNIEEGLDHAIAQAIGDESVQEGDVVILTSSLPDHAEAFAGAYIFTSDADRDNVAGKYSKIYVQNGQVTSVGGATPENGSVTLKVNGQVFSGGEVTIGLEDIENSNLLVTSDVAGMTVNVEGSVIKVGELSVDTAEVTALRTEVGPATSAKTSNIYERLNVIEASLGLGGDSGTEGIADLLAKEIEERKADDALLLAGINAEIAARKADDKVLETAINAEIDARVAEDILLNSAIEAEIANRKSEDALLNGAIESEIANRKADDAELAAQIKVVDGYRKSDSDALKSAIDSEIDARKADNAAIIESVNGKFQTLSSDLDAAFDVVDTNIGNVKTAVQGAVKLASISVEVSATQDAPVFSYTMQNAGLVFAVVDGNGVQVFPTITYANSIATLQADYEGASPEGETWTIHYAANPTVAALSEVANVQIDEVAITESDVTKPTVADAMADITLEAVGAKAELKAEGAKAELSGASEKADLQNENVPADVVLQHND